MRYEDDSQVVDALKQGHNLERVLRALHCSISKDDGSEFESRSGYINCPMPNHPDRNPSAQVLADIGCIECWSQCGTIRPLDLVVEHGKAADRGEAAKWIEDVLGIEPVNAKPPVPIVDDPSLTVREYLAMRGLPDWIAERFHLEDVSCWAPGFDKGTANVTYETGWYTSVFMPLREGRRPRVRWQAPKSKLRWAPKVRHSDGRIDDYTRQLNHGGPATEWPLDLIGMDQFASTLAADPGAMAILSVVEGESDVHASHAMGLPFTVGVPGTKNVKRLQAELVEAALQAVRGDVEMLAQLVVVVWQEPGKAGSAFPSDVATHLREGLRMRSLPECRFATLRYDAVEGKPKDPASLLTMLPPAEAARRLSSALFAAALEAVGAPAPEQSGPAPLQPSVNAQAALDVAQVDGLHTPPPATELTVEQILAAAPPEGPPVEPAQPTPAPPSYMTADAEMDAEQNQPDWGAYDDHEEPPARDLSPHRVEGFAQTFYRSEQGWQVTKVSKDGDKTYVTICSPFVVEALEECAGELMLRIAAPFGSQWRRLRFDMTLTADAGRTCAQLAKIGVQVVNRQRPAVTDLLISLAARLNELVGTIKIPAGTGWSGRPGVGGFGGIDVEPLNDFGARMYEANRLRREMRPDVAADAQEWWRRGVMPMLGPDAVARPTMGTAAVLLAIGAACAAPLVGPLGDVGVSISPVVWLAGLGGGGKTVTQTLVATIYAPRLPSIDGQVAYFASANITQAALSARVDSCRDLPLLLDDVTQLPPLPGSTSKGDAARIEAAAALGMLVFNRKSIERATREGGIRQTKPFRSTAVFSAEVNMNSAMAKAVVTAGQRRRISTIEARPMTERGLGPQYAEAVNDLAKLVGGAPADVLIPVIREVVSQRTLRQHFEAVRAKLQAMPEAAEVTATQCESLAATVLGFALMAHAVGADDFNRAVDMALRVLGPYMALAADQGGATRDDDLGGVQRVLAAIEDMLGAQQHRFDGDALEDLTIPVPTQGWLGKRIADLETGERRVVLLQPGMDMLDSRYGITAQVVEQAVHEGIAKVGHQVRMANGSRPRGVMWILPSDDADDDDQPDEPTDAPHDPDPYNLTSPNEEHEVPTFNLGGTPLTIPDDHPLAAPLAKLDMSEAYTMIFQPDFHDGVKATVEGPNERVIIYQEGTVMKNMRFLWGANAGMYAIEDVNATAQDPEAYNQVLQTIRDDVRGELSRLQEFYGGAAEADPQGALGAPLEVADFPADDDPRWAQIDAFGYERARAQWGAHFESLWRANHAATPEEQRAYHELHVKQVRIHLMCRYRHPEWFLISEADVPLLSQAA